jgi:hypothetical protein
LCDHSDALARGETGVLLCIAQDQRIATKILDFVQADIEGSHILRGLFKGRRSDTIELTSNVNIEVRPASFRKLRGPTYIGVIADELAFWYTDSGYANPDIEILAAVRPGLLTTRGPLIMASSPYAKQGVLWDTFRYGANGAPTKWSRPVLAATTKWHPLRKPHITASSTPPAAPVTTPSRWRSATKPDSSRARCPDLHLLSKRTVQMPGPRRLLSCRFHCPKPQS